MRLAKLKVTVAAATMLAGVIAAMPASATPYVGIRGFWSVGPLYPYPIPDGIAISCSGHATASGMSCSDSVSLSATVTTSGHQEVTSSGGVVVTNTTDHMLAGTLFLGTGFSAFNPGGPNVGIHIDDPVLEAASFHSSIGGRGTGDSHSCSVGFLGESGRVFSPTDCGVGSPDSSDLQYSVDLSTLVPQDSITFSYLIDIACDFIIPPPVQPPADEGVPEPASAGVLLAGLLGLRFRKRG
jgi:hypothetical protein